MGTAWLTLALFVVANFLYQVSLVFYNALLPSVAPPGRQGRISGLGVGLGYLGQPLALPVAFLLAAKLSGAGLNGEGVTFAVAGVCVLLFSIPLFLWVPERRVAFPVPLDASLVHAEYSRFWTRLRRLPGQRNVFLFLVGNFLCVEVLNTAIFWTAVYLARVAGLSRGDIIATLVAVNVCAFLAGCALGWVTDRIGAKRTMLAAGLALLLLLPVLAIATNPWMVRIGLCTLGATGLSGIWVAGRKLLLDLVPEERAGEFFGLYGLTNKGAAFGMALFGILGDWIGMRLALGLTTIPLIAGIACISRVDPEGGLTGRSEE
jgi:UMF1 family MFS transporter